MRGGDPVHRARALDRVSVALDELAGRCRWAVPAQDLHSRSPAMSVGVIVGRFQVAAPTVGHLALISRVMERHKKILICLGVSPTRLSATDPLDYAARERMMRSHFPTATITPVYDNPSDERWSQQLDQTVARLFP